MCVENGDALKVVFNIEAGNYYSKSDKLVTLRESCLHIGYFIHSGVLILQNCLRVSKDFQFRVSGS